MGENISRIEKLTSELNTLKKQLKTLNQKHLEISDSEKKYRLLAENMMDLVALHEPDGRYKYLSPSVTKLLGFTPEELIGEDPYKLFHPDDTERIKNEAHTHVLNRKEIINTVYRIRKKSGKYIWFNTSTKPVINDKNEIVELQTVSKDVTDHQKILDALTESEYKYKQLLENTHLGIAYYDTNGKILYMNKKVSENFGGEPEDFIGKSLTDITEKKLAKFLIRRMQNNLKEGKKKSYEDHFHQLGKDVFVATNFCPVKNSIGESTGALYVTEIITEKKLIEIALKESEEKYRVLFDESMVGKIITDHNGNIYEANESFKKLFAYSENELKNISSKSLFKKKSDRIQVFETLNSKKGLSNFHTELISKNKKTIWGNINAINISINNKIYFLISCNDITEIKLAEQKLQKSEEKYRSIVELSPDGIVTLDLKGTILNVNKAFTEISGYSKKDFVGKNFLKAPTLIKQNLNVYIQLFYNIIQGNSNKRVEFKWKHKNSEIRYGEAHSMKLTESNKVTGMLGIVSDITERKKAEEEIIKHRKHLEELVKERTLELEEKNEELEKFNQLFIGREFRIKELKDKIKILEAEKSN